MSVLTKIFVVLLVVVSLLSAAGFIVFVNQVQSFRTSLANVQSQYHDADATAKAAKSELAAMGARLLAAQADADAARSKAETQANADAATVAGLNVQLATAASQARIAAVSMDNVSGALTTSEAIRKGLGESLASARADVDRLNKTGQENEIAISDLTNKLDVARRTVTNTSEQLVESKANVDRLSSLAREHGYDANQTVDRVSLSAPAINGVVRDTRPINGTPYATISVGSAEQVTKGMVFQVIDRARSKFLGELTIDSVDLHNATGKLEGPGVSDVRKDGSTEVHTQL